MPIRDKVPISDPVLASSCIFQKKGACLHIPQARIVPEALLIKCIRYMSPDSLVHVCVDCTSREIFLAGASSF